MLCGFKDAHTTPAGAGPGCFIKVGHNRFNLCGRWRVSALCGLGLLFLGFLLLIGQTCFHQCFEFRGLLQLVNTFEFCNKFIPQGGGAVLLVFIIVGSGIA